MAGASVWKFVSVDDGVDPDVREFHLLLNVSNGMHIVLIGIGTEVTLKVITAAVLLRQLIPALRVRVVNASFMILGTPGSHPYALGNEDFDSLFSTPERPSSSITTAIRSSSRVCCWVVRISITIGGWVYILLTGMHE